VIVVWVICLEFVLISSKDDLVGVRCVVVASKCNICFVFLCASLTIVRSVCVCYLLVIL